MDVSLGVTIITFCYLYWPSTGISGMNRSYSLIAQKSRLLKDTCMFEQNLSEFSEDMLKIRILHMHHFICIYEICSQSAQFVFQPITKLYVTFVKCPGYSEYLISYAVML